MHRSVTRALLFINLPIALLAPASHAEDTETLIHFRFGPPEITFERRVTSERTRAMSDGTRQIDENSGTETITISRTGDGYRMAVQPTDLTVKRNGVTVNNPLLKTLQSLEVVYVLDEDGHLESVTGYEVVPAMLARMASNLPEATRNAILTAFSADALQAREKAEHQGRIEHFVGRRVRIGSVTTDTSSYTLPTGESIEFTSAIHFADTAPCGDTTCVVIEHAYNSDPNALPAMVPDIVDHLPTAEHTGETTGTMAIEGRARRVIDPATMLIHAESLERTIQMTIDVPGQKALPMTLTEHRNYTYTYPAATDG